MTDKSPQKSPRGYGVETFRERFRIKTLIDPLNNGVDGDTKDVNGAPFLNYYVTGDPSEELPGYYFQA